jgi:hypothetical protein
MWTLNFNPQFGSGTERHDPDATESGSETLLSWNMPLVQALMSIHFSGDGGHLK